MTRWLTRALVIAFAPLAAAAPPAAAATVPTCDSLPNPIYIQMGSTQVNLIKRMGRALRDDPSRPMTLVYLSSGSCTNIDNFYHHTAALTQNMSYIPSKAEDASWTPDQPALTCTPPAGGVFPDVGNSATFIASCTQEAPPATVQLENGGVLPYILAVPKGSSQVAITAEEGYFVFGFGTAGMVTPWTDENEMFIRPVTKSTLLTWSATLTVPVAKFKGVSLNQSQQVIAALESAADPESAIGILSTADYEAERANLTELAFRAFHQYAAYFADSTSTSHDKQNVRDGHYTVWAPTIWMYNTDGSGNAVEPDAKYLVDMLAGHEVTPAPSFDPNAFVAQVGMVPDCAMRVTRSFDGGPLSLYHPQTSCTCSFMAAVETSTCATCDASTPCASGVCRNGYCEEF